MRFTTHPCDEKRVWLSCCSTRRTFWLASVFAALSILWLSSCSDDASFTEGWRLREPVPPPDLIDAGDMGVVKDMPLEAREDAGRSCPENQETMQGQCVPCPEGMIRRSEDEACKEPYESYFGLGQDEFEEAYLKDPIASRTLGTRFGSSIAMHGGTLVVSEERSSTCHEQEFDHPSDCQRSPGVYVYRRVRDELGRGAWQFEALIEATSENAAENIVFGERVAIWGDHIAVTSPFDGRCEEDALTEACEDSGSVTMYERSYVDGVAIWRPVAFLRPDPDIRTHEFGRGLSLGEEHLAVGVKSETYFCEGSDGSSEKCSEGSAVYTYRRTSVDGETTWKQTGYLKSSNHRFRDEFGVFVSVDGNRLAASAYRESSCARGVGGDQADTGCDDAGAVYIFDFDEEKGWVQTAYLKSSDTLPEDYFGLGISLRGEWLAVISNKRRQDLEQRPLPYDEMGAVYVFRYEDGVYSEVQKLVIEGSDGSSTRPGFVVIGNHWMVVGSIPDDDCTPGVSPPMASLGDCRDAGAVHLFKKEQNEDRTVWQHHVRLKSSNPDKLDFFGRWIALSDHILAIAAHQEQSCATGFNGDQNDDGCRNAGAVYIRKLSRH